jgi:hypothetical protein
MRFVSREPWKSYAIEGLLWDNGEEGMEEFFVATRVSFDPEGGRGAVRTFGITSRPSLE